MSFNSDDDSQRAALTLKLSHLSEKRWQVEQDTKFITKTFFFENWTRCLNFAQLVEIDSWSYDHHALLKLTRQEAAPGAYFAATVRWFTYKNMPARVSMRDINSAERTDIHATTAIALATIPTYAPGQQQVRIPAEVEIASCLESGWLYENNRIIQKFHFSTYTKCRDFVHLVGIESKTRTYHPEVVYFPCWVQIKWPFLLKKDILTVAHFCNEAAKKIGTTDDTNEGSHACTENL